MTESHKDNKLKLKDYLAILAIFVGIFSFIFLQATNKVFYSDKLYYGSIILCIMLIIFPFVLTFMKFNDKNKEKLKYNAVFCFGFAFLLSTCFAPRLFKIKMEQQYKYQVNYYDGSSQIEFLPKSKAVKNSMLID